jgi:hypothetical protein
MVLGCVMHFISSRYDVCELHNIDKSVASRQLFPDIAIVDFQK